MGHDFEAEIRALTERLLLAIRDRDWDAYAALCEPDLTCFEPESRGALVEGLDFHRFYFEMGGHLGPHQDSIVAPTVRALGDAAALIAYVRLVQRTGEEGKAYTGRFEETRIWRRAGDGWKHVHFHRSNEDRG